ncbi:MAG: 2-oxo acid dehydrogenase subunit E2 [Pseudomonadota bacterium]
MREVSTLYDKKGLFELAANLGQISQKARAGKLSPTDMQGACFTISSLGRRLLL